jgi:predicted metalloprotease with PDZ domain
MNFRCTGRGREWLAAGCVLLLCASVRGQPSAIQLEVDARDAPRKILHAQLRIPCRPGPLTLLYPKWIPGEHSPNGPIADVVDLKFNAGGQPLSWQRDAEDMFTFHLQVPAGAHTVDVSLDFLLPPSEGDFSSGASASAQLLDLSWNQVSLYPKGAKASDLRFIPTLRLPGGWKFGTALTVTRESPDRIEFAPVSLETLVDSPVIAGAYFRTIELEPGTQPPHWLEIVADSAAALELRPEHARQFSRLVLETGSLFGARHYRSYHFLLTLSDHVAHFGLEHHESSDNREPEDYLINQDALKLGGFLLPHEMVHSWNGKYRRPLGLATADFQQPMKGELLWVYEGLTDYLGIVLATRCGLWGAGYFREYLALEAAKLDAEAGRKWRPLADTAVAAQLLYSARKEGEARRRSVDFYSEGDLIWLEADVLIRQQTNGRRSLDDFCKRFYGGASGPPKVVPYGFEDIVAALNEVSPFDWREFFRSRVYATTAHAPLGGIERAGWRLSFTNAVPERLKTREATFKYTDLSYSLGLTIKEDGSFIDVLPGFPAAKAGLAPAMKLLAVNGRRWTPERLRAAVKAAGTNAPLELLVENEDYFTSLNIDYHQGEKYPQLEADRSKPDLLSQILKPTVTPAIEKK